jgi:glutamate-1-semialdehyde 2,1-aminomutase
VAARHPSCAVTIGGMPSTPTLTFNLGADAPLAQTLYIRRMRERGFLVASYAYMMLAQRDEDRSDMLEALDVTLGKISRSISEGRLEADSGVARGLRGFARLA